MIGEIANQTSLLVLSATIGAARVGEVGKEITVTNPARVPYLTACRLASGSARCLLGETLWATMSTMRLSIILPPTREAS